MAAGRHGGFRGCEFSDRESTFTVSRREVGYHDKVRVRQRDGRGREVGNGEYGSYSTGSDSGCKDGGNDPVKRRHTFPVKTLDREPGELSSESGSEDTMELDTVKDGQKLENGVHSSPVAEKKRNFSPIVWDRDDEEASTILKRRASTIVAITKLPPPPPLPKSFIEVPTSENGGVGISLVQTNFAQMVHSPGDNMDSDSDSYPSPVPSSVSRLWRPAAQRNLRNQWSKLVSGKQEWASASASGRTHATALVNTYLSQRYMVSMELGVLNDLPDIRPKACQKLSMQQEFHWRKLLSSYASLVAAVSQMVNARESMRCYTSQTSDSPIMKFLNSPVNQNDNGDGGGFPVFTFLSIPFSEDLAQELVEMFELELTLKRLLVMELLAVGYEERDCGKICCWHDELYSGEFDDLALCHLYKIETSEVSSVGLKGRHFHVPSEQNSKLKNATLQAYLTTWISAINVDSRRVDKILAIVGEDMNVSFR